MRGRVGNLATTARGYTQSASPVPKLLVGFLLEVFFVMGSILHIQTSEAFFLGGTPVGLSANWGILGQPYMLFTAQFGPKMAEAVMWGWGIELVFLTCVVGLKVAMDGVAGVSGGLAKLFLTGAIVLVLFDAWTDFNYGNVASGFWGQVAFAAITAFIVFFFGSAGWNLIKSGLEDLGR